jgi:hypothetical protein
MSELTTMKECRICFEKEDIHNILISPCLCNGTSKYVHKKCIIKWRQLCESAEAKEKCMECRAPYLFTYEYPKEEKMIFGVQTITGYYFIIYIFTSIISALCIYFDKKYIIIKLIIPESKTYPIVSYLNIEPMTKYILYSSFSLYLVTIIFMLCMCYGIRFRMFRRKKYLYLMANSIISYIMNILLYIPIYNLVFIDFTTMFLFTILYIFLQPIYILSFIYKNDKVLKKINTINIQHFLEYDSTEIELLNIRNELEDEGYYNNESDENNDNENDNNENDNNENDNNENDEHSDSDVESNNDNQGDDNENRNSDESNYDNDEYSDLDDESINDNDEYSDESNSELDSYNEERIDMEYYGDIENNLNSSMEFNLKGDDDFESYPHSPLMQNY